MEVTYSSQVIRLCQELVQAPSLPGQERRVGEIVQDYMRMLDYDRVDCDELGNILGVVEGTGDTVILLDAHMDTVPVTEAESWRFDPHSARIKDGRIWGRGTTDTKGSLAAALVAIGSLTGATRPRATVVMAATVGEEMMEGAALAPLLTRYRPKAVVVCEPTGLRIGIGHKGRAGVILDARGIPAHSSRPEHGLNAAYVMLEAIQRIRQLPAKRDQLLGQGVRELVEIISSPYPGTSMVPDGCRARFDCRLVRGETPETLIEEFVRACNTRRIEVRLHQATLECYTRERITLQDYHAAWIVDPQGPLVTAAQRAMRGAGLCSETWVAPYCTNGATSAGEYGIPTIVYGAGDVTDAHVVNESLSISELERAFLGYQALVRELAWG